MIAAGLLAGAVLALFHTFLTEPIVGQVVALEEASATQGEAAPVVTRPIQRLGLVVGSLFHGLFVGVIFGGVFYLVQTGLTARRLFNKALVLALSAYWLVGLLPFLKYPDNPPGVGLPETNEYRQALSLSFLLLSLVGGLVAANAARYIDRRWLVAAGYLAFVVGLYLAMPPNLDPLDMPASLITTFRALSLVGLTLFWLALGVGFGLLVERLEPDQRARGFQPRAA